jgi:hypothetical protein
MRPTARTLRVLADDLGIALPDDRLYAAVEDHARLRPGLEELRALELCYLELVEPATPVQWIATGGRLPARDRVWET